MPRKPAPTTDDQPDTDTDTDTEPEAERGAEREIDWVVATTHTLATQTTQRLKLNRTKAVSIKNAGAVVQPHHLIHIVRDPHDRARQWDDLTNLGCDIQS